MRLRLRLPLPFEDLRRAAGAAVYGCAAVVAGEWLLSILSAQGPVRVATAVRFLFVDLALVAVGALVAIPLAAALVPAALAVGRRVSVRWLWGAVAGALLYVVGSTLLTLTLSARKEPSLVAVTLAVLQLGLAALAAGVAVGTARLLRRAETLLPPRLRVWNPLSQFAPALVLLLVAVFGAVPIVLALFPQARGIFPWASPWRDAMALALFAVGFGLGHRLLARRGRFWPEDLRRRRLAMGATALGWLLVVPLSLWKLAADPETKYLAVSASPTLAHLVALVRAANDFDGDGYGSLLGENDCAPFRRRIHPGARDLPDNGIDENCSGSDFSAKGLPSYRTGERMAVPPEFKRSWNFLLVTIDTVRYDHTSFGGYKSRPDRKRDTTPRLAELVARSVSFTFANAPSAGTMASVPAILTSRFFHSGIALEDTGVKGDPPKLRPENTIIPEILKRAGYRTGAILTHEYFKNWGLDQGVDDYDNSLGARPDPFRSTAPQVTDKAQAWIARQGAARWFLWVHYIDPHGRYVAHPGGVSFGAGEEDLYDGELAFTDEHLGRLLDYVQRSPVADRTIIVITSDHGDGFKEHGFINHGMALFKELLHVPLIVYVPDVEPRTVDGPVSPLDILPTLADLAGVDLGDLTVEGESLVPQLFYGRDARDRIVFAETNWPDPLRAAISDRHKLIFNLKANLYQLYDLKSDPWEKKNVWGKDKANGERMKALLDEWLERVYFSRDRGNQAQEERARILLSARPSPKVPVSLLLQDAIEVLGWDPLGEAKVGGALSLDLYLHARAPTASSLKFEVEARGSQILGPPRPVGPRPMVPPPPPGPGPAVVRQEIVPAEGLFPTHRWQPGDLVKLSFLLRIPTTWQPGDVTLSLRVLDEKRAAVGSVVLGTVPLTK